VQLLAILADDVVDVLNAIVTGYPAVELVNVDPTLMLAMVNVPELIMTLFAPLLPTFDAFAAILLSDLLVHELINPTELNNVKITVI
jgi:hypothetical protein